MYAGHLGFALGTYSFRRTVPLWLLVIAAQLPDWFDAGMCFADLDRGPVGLYTHGLYMVAGGALVLAALYAIVTRDLIGCCIVALTVASHYALDYLTGIKPTWPNGPIIGLQLYQRPMMDMVLEGGTILIGWLLYRRTLPYDTRNDAKMYILLFGLLLFQLFAGVAFLFNLGGQMKC